MLKKISTNILVRQFQLYPLRSIIGYTVAITALVAMSAPVVAQKMDPIKYHNIECVTPQFGTVTFNNVLDTGKIGNNCKVIK